MRSTLVMALLTVLISLSPRAAQADLDEPNVLPACDFLGAGLGPMIGWSFGRGTEGKRLFGGVEATGGCPWLRLSLGAVYRRTTRGEPRESVYWAAWEPGLIHGASVGVSYSTELGVLPALGTWLGGGAPIAGDLRYEPRKRDAHGVFTTICASLGVGVRVRFGAGVTRTDLYVTPKVQYCTYPQFNT